MTTRLLVIGITDLIELFHLTNGNISAINKVGGLVDG
jgi:hypothetical protein